MNRDGLLDLFLPQYGGPSRLWVARGRPDRFRLEAAGRGIADAGFATGAVFADYDNDGDQDLYVVRHGLNSLYENDGRGHFRDIARLVGVADPGRGSSAAFADFDRDGRLDLYVANGDNCGRPVAAPDRLYRNRGGRFEDVTRDLHGSDAGEGIGLQAAWLDYDRDGDPDLYLANDHLGFRGNELWRNDGGSKGRWRFTAVGASSGADLRLSSMGLAIGDLDRDGRTDLAVSDEGPPQALLNGGRGFERASIGLPGSVPLWGLVAADFDNDGREDVFAAAGALGLRAGRHRDRLYLAADDGFAEVGERAGLADPGRGRGVAAADFDRDGRLDLLVARLGQAPLLYRNLGTRKRRHWLELRLVGSRSARDACGARVSLELPRGRPLARVVDCGSQGLGSSGERIVHFGLGRARRYRELAVAWPSGTRDSYGAGPTDRILTLPERRR